MYKGQKVTLNGIVSGRGTRLETLRPEFEKKMVGIIVSGPDEIDWYYVQFPSELKPFEVPRELLDNYNKRT